MLKAMIQIEIGKWLDVKAAGGDPVLMTIDTLRDSLGNPAGFGECHWQAGVIDFGGQRFLPFDPYGNAPFGTMMVQCLMLIHSEGDR